MSLKSQASKGFVWNALEKFSVQFVQLLVTFLLTKLLLPRDFGLIGMLSIFIGVSQTFVDGGMASGLIQKKNRTDLDYSTVFIFNMVVAIVVYLILFFSAPLISKFFNQPELTLITRVLSLNIILSSFTIVQRTRLNIVLDFKTLAKVNLSAVVISSVIAIIMAYLNYGVWALVAQQVIIVFVAMVLFWILSKKPIALRFSKDSFRKLFGFSSKILIQRIYGIIFQNIYNISLGKFYSAQTLGFFTRAKSFTTMSSGIISQILQQVTFPLLSEIQEDKDRLVSVYRRIIKMTAFVTLPLMTMLALVADPLIRVLFEKEWYEVIVLLQWFAISQITYPIAVVNMNILNVVGRSDLYLKVDLFKLPMVVIALVITIPLGVEAMVIGLFITSYISFFINAYLPGKMFGYGAIGQLKDMLPFIFTTLGMTVTVFVIQYLFENLYLQLSFSLIVAFLSYWIFSELLKVKELKEVKLLITQLRSKIKNS